MNALIAIRLNTRQNALNFFNRKPFVPTVHPQSGPQVFRLPAANVSGVSTSPSGSRDANASASAFFVDLVANEDTPAGNA